MPTMADARGQSLFRLSYFALQYRRCAALESASAAAASCGGAGRASGNCCANSASAGFGPIVCVRRLLRGRLGRLRRADHLRQQIGDIAGRNGPEAGHGVGVVEVPAVLDQADKVANCRIGGPSATKCRAREIRRNPGSEKGANIGFRADRFDRRQAGGIERGLRGRRIGCRWMAAKQERRPSLRPARVRPPPCVCAATTDR